MPDDDWSRGKCGLKLLQYMAAGLPVVANPVGVHREMVRDGETGFLADSVDDWSEALVRLRDPGLRARMGAAGRSLVERCYSTSAWERSFVEAVTGRAEVGADSQARPRRRLLPPQAASGAGPHGAKFRNPADGLEARSTGGAP